MEESQTNVCPNCKREIPTVNFTIHTVHCARNIKVCPVCKEPVPLNELQEHHDKLHKLMPCKQCGESVCGTDLEDHIRDSCGHTIKSCRYCELELPRHELPAHEGYCGVRTEQCPECREWVMIKYRQLHLDSNHGFLRLDDDPVPQPKKVPPKSNANPIRDMLASTSNLRNGPPNGMRPAVVPTTRVLFNASGSNIDRNTEARRTDNASGSPSARNGIVGTGGEGGGSPGNGGGSRVSNGSVTDGRRYVSENVQQQNLSQSALKIRKFFAMKRKSNLAVAKADLGQGASTDVNSDFGEAWVKYEALKNAKQGLKTVDEDAFTSSKCVYKRGGNTLNFGVLAPAGHGVDSSGDKTVHSDTLTSSKCDSKPGVIPVDINVLSRANHEALNDSRPGVKTVNLDAITSSKCGSKRGVVPVDIEVLSQANHGALNDSRRGVKSIDLDAITSSKCGSKRGVVPVDINVLSRANRQALNDSTRGLTTVDLDALTFTKCNSKAGVVPVDTGVLKTVDSNLEVIRGDYEALTAVNHNSISEDIQKLSEGVPIPSSSSGVRSPNGNGVTGGSGDRKPLAKRSNDQPQINTAVGSVNKIHKDMATSRGAVKKRPAPKPPADRKRDLQYYSALQRQQAEERQRQEQTAYNALLGLPPALSAAAKLEKLRKMDALNNRETEDTDYKNRLQGRVWMGSDASTSAGHRLRSNSPEDPNVRNELRNLKPMTPEEFQARFERLQLSEPDGARPAKADRFSEIKSSLRELRRGLNEVTAPYNSNATNNQNDRQRRRSPSSSPVEDLRDDLEVDLPCEFCGAPVPAQDLVQHQTGCRPDLTQFRPRSRSPQPVEAPARHRPPPLPADPYENPVIPCEFCTESLPVYLISEHQERCRRDPNLLFPD